MKTSINDLVKISRYAGRHPQWVQGAGGNCSIKDGHVMHIKSSGIFLEEVSENNGHVAVSLKNGEPLPDQKQRASLETPLHLHLGKAVIHTHPISLGIYLCAKNGKETLTQKLLSESFPWNFVWIEYATPGKKLYEQVKERIKSFDLEQPLVLFLENHGLFVSAQTSDEAIFIHESMAQKIPPYEELFEENFQKPTQYLTPDHVVFFNLKELSGKNRQTYEELVVSHQLIEANLQKLNLSPKYLTDAQVAELLNMEEEKYRQRINA